ncbi:WXG100 family type VII secretion target [Kitasatospora sp. NPDC048540]|uniref:WXG100 family type VII secretion target n=1 Tax=Kitasatospora sp. NPDC048540 TaxID=3155634 RepID=UPI003409AFE6
MAQQLTQVELAGMTAAQGTFQNAVDSATSSYAQIEGQVEALHGSWQGEAATIYGQAMQEWLADFRSLNQALTKMLETLSANTHVYANTHQDTSQVAHQVAAQVSAGSGLVGFPL